MVSSLCTEKSEAVWLISSVIIKSTSDGNKDLALC